ncbi:MAG: DUF5684 domain-containing protein [Parcubacteria group bacterium]
MNQINIPNESILPIVGGLFIFLFIFFSLCYVYMSICLLKIARKTNTGNAWFAWIPILDMLLALEIAKKPTWWIIWFFIPVANLVTYVLVWMGISKILRKPEWLGILMIISPLNLIVPGYLAFSRIDNTPQKPEIKIMNVSL